MKVYVYKDKEYSSIWQFRNEHREYLLSSNAPESVLNSIGIVIKEIPDPEPEPYIETEEDKLRNAKNIRNSEVQNITVEVDGMVFDGNENAQRRMSAVIEAWPSDADTVNWVLHDNTVQPVTKEQLVQAFTLAVQKMVDLWTVPYDSQDNTSSNDSNESTGDNE